MQARFQNGNLTCSIDANAQAGLQPKNAFNCSESRTYDELNRVTKIIDALNGETDHSAKVTSYKPDEVGNVYEKTNRLAEVTRYTFDNGNRLTRVDYLKDSTAESFGYDAAGNRSAAANGIVSYAWTPRAPAWPNTGAAIYSAR